MIIKIILALLLLGFVYIWLKRRQLIRQAEQNKFKRNDKEEDQGLQKSVSEARLIAKNNPFRVQRCAVILSPKQKMVAWINATSEGEYHRPITLEDGGRFYQRVYLVSCDDHEKIMKRILANKAYFISGVTDSYPPKSRWAWKPEPEEFDDWFEVTIVNELWDIETNEITKEPDEFFEVAKVTHSHENQN